MSPEDKVQKLIALKRYENPPPGFFDDFLEEFQQRQREELLRKSSLSLFGERVGIWFKELGMSKWLVGGGLAYGALTLAFLGWQNKPVNEVPSSKIAPAAYQAPRHSARPIPAVDFENGKRYQASDSRRELRREF